MDVKHQKIELIDSGNIESWTEDLRNIPDVYMINIFLYLTGVCCLTKERLENYKSDNSFQSD